MGRAAEYKHRKRLIGRALWLAGTLLWCATTSAAPVYTLQVDLANSYVEVAPIWIFPPPGEGPPFPDPPGPTRYPISGTLEIISFAPSAWSSANVRIRTIELVAGPVLLPEGDLFGSSEGLLGHWEGTAIEFTDNGCAFFVGPGSCWSAGDFAFASGTFDGEHLDIAGTIGGLLGPDYKIVADIVSSAQVPEPTTLGLLLVGLAFAAATAPARPRRSGKPR